MDAEKLENLIQGLKRNPLEKEALLEFPEQQQEAVLLAVALKSIPIINPPRAVQRRKYEAQTEAMPAFAFSSLFHFRFIASTAVVVFMVLGGGFAYVTFHSLPGQTLFSVKKSAEQFRVKFASNDIQRAYLQVQIAKKRVAEAEKLAASDNNDPELALAALKEVTQATETASKEVKTLTAKDIKASEDPLLAALEDVSKKEKDLVAGITPDNQTQDQQDVIALSLRNQTRVSEIKQAVETATAEEAITSLSSGLGTVVVSGQITQVNKNSFTIEKTQFIFGEKTEVVSQDGEKLPFESLKIEAKAAATGKKTDGKLIALKLTVFDVPQKEGTAEEAAGEVKGEATEADKPTSTTPDTILKPILDEAPVGGEAAEANPNSATGGYIIEDPNPQFVP